MTALYFIIDCYLKKYLLLYVFYTKTESGGQFWRALFNRFLVAAFFSNIVIAFIVIARADVWAQMLGALAPLPFLLIAFKVYCSKTFDDQTHFYTKGHMIEDAVADNKSRRSTNVAVRFGHPAIYKPLLTPMVSEKSKHLLSQVYKGRLDDDDGASMMGFSDTYSLNNLSMNGRTKKSNKAQGPFEFVAESDMDFENFKDRADFRTEHGGEGGMYGHTEDSMSRAGTPMGFRKQSQAGLNGHDRERSSSRDSERTLAGPGGGLHTRNASMSSLNKMNTVEGFSTVPLQGTTYTPGYHQQRGYSPSPVRRPVMPNGYDSQRDLLGGAAPMGFRGLSPYRAPDVDTPGSQGSGGTPGEQDLALMNGGYDYFRGRKR